MYLTVNGNSCNIEKPVVKARKKMFARDTDVRRKWKLYSMVGT